MNSIFSSLMKKRGFHETIILLHSLEKKEEAQNSFFTRLQNSECYYNAYLRVKKNLLERDIIAFKLDQYGNKIIYLTEKGIVIASKLLEIENMLTVME